MKYVLDIETNGLLEQALDYSTLPYKLKPSFSLWCIVVKGVYANDSGVYPTKRLVLSECTKENLKEALKDCTELIAHNGIMYDFPVLKLLGLLDYEVAYPTFKGESEKKSKLFGRDVILTDTLVWSKLLAPDRIDGHSLRSWGERFGDFKIDYHDFSKYTPEMLEYCDQDCNVTVRVYHKLMKDREKGNYSRAYAMESKLVDLTLKQSLFGFEFDLDLAESCLKELDSNLKDIQDRVNPRLPERKLGETEKAKVAPPKKPFLKTGELSSAAFKYADKIGGKIVEGQLLYKGVLYDFPLTKTPVESYPATVDDLDNLKKYLIDLGWEPSEWKERDLSRNQDKTKKTLEAQYETIDRYIKQTFRGYFAKERADILQIACTPEAFELHLKKLANKDKPIRVPTGPKLSVGLEKTICPNLESLGEKADFVGDVVKYFTYKHRRSAISGGLQPDPEDLEEGEEIEPEKGYLAEYRKTDGRIPTPADTLAAVSARYRHKKVCNVPRGTTLYGDKMRSLFKAGKGLVQMGYDFSSLEGRIQGHYCIPYDGKELAELLILEKPNDIHTKNSKKFSMPRTDVKSVFYGLIYGCAVPKLAKMTKKSLSDAAVFYDDFWNSVLPLKLFKDALEDYWETKGQRKYVPGIDGRLLCSRSRHSLVNLMFQSAGALAVKWSVVRSAEQLEAKGLLGNPFEDSIDTPKVWMMIVYHDECQYAVHPSLLEIHKFDSEDAAKEARTSKSSAISHNKEGFYVAHETTPIACIKESIDEVTKELKIRVPLGIEWVTGNNWFECH